MFSEEKMSYTGQKTNKVLVKNLFTQKHLMILNTKKTAKVNCVLKMLIKRKPD